jgi:cytokinesis protein
MKRKQALTPTPGAETPPSPATSGAMDDLLAKLRAAKPEARDQRERRRRARLKDKHIVRVASGQQIPETDDLVDDNAPSTETGLLSPHSEQDGSEAGDQPAAPAEPAESKEVDIADQAASLLQGLGGNSSDEREGAGLTRESSTALRVRRRRDAEDERNRRRQRRQHGRSTALSDGSKAITEDGEEDELRPISMSPRKLPTPTTIISPPSPAPGKDFGHVMDAEESTEIPETTETKEDSAKPTNGTH